MRILFVYLSCFTMLFLSACTGSDYDFAKESATDSAQAISSPQGIDVDSASSAQCANGGSVYTVFLDDNKNSLKDAGENVISTQVVCNGVNGSDGANGVAGSNGLSTVFAVNRVAIGLSACVAGSGLQVSLGLDQNFNASLDASEITQAQVLCDGERGADGATGATGNAGHSLVVKTVAATVDVCASGGTTILLAQDIHNNGVYDIAAPMQQSVNICNGENAQTPAYAPVESIMPCGNTVAYKEVLLRLGNGQVLASFSNNTGGSMTRLAFLPDGTFMNTDTSACVFSLATSSDGNTRSISWFGEVQKTWAMFSE